MTDYLSRASRLQLTTAIQNLISTAVFEISQIFEQSLHDHEVELARKGEEITHLKVKLQETEMKLRDLSAHGEKDKSITRTSPRKSKVPSEESTIPEIHFEDWCIPLGSENVINRENPCPSVRLKQFSIPLWPISLKHEAFQKIQETSLRPRHNRDKIGLHENINHKQKRGRPRKHPLENDSVKHVLVNIKQEPSDIQVESSVRRRDLSGKVPTSYKLKRKVHKSQGSATKQKYQCRFCPKTFDTAFGLGVHDRLHKKCKGCKKIFPFTSILEQHKVGCKYYKKLMKLSIPSPEKVKNSSSIKQIKGNALVESTSPDRRIQTYTCRKCTSKFVSRSLLRKHSCNFVCRICSKRFSSQINLKEHHVKVHKKSNENKLELSWTKPLDESENDFSESENNIKKCPDGFKRFSLRGSV